MLSTSKLSLLALILVCFGLSASQTQSMWKELPQSAKSELNKTVRAKAALAYYAQIDPQLLQQQFTQVKQKKSIDIPLPNGSMLPIELIPSPIMTADFAAKYPYMMTYTATQIGQPENIGRFSISHLGLFGFFRYNGKWMLLSPQYMEATGEYLSYWYKDAEQDSDRQGLASDMLFPGDTANEFRQLQKLAPTGDSVRTYRLAVATTAEYTIAVGGSKANVVAEIMNLVNRINQVLLIDVALQFELVDNEDIIFTDATSDPYTNDDASSDLPSNQTAIDDAIGSSNYDIGHLLSTNGGGLAFVGVTCNSRFKAQGYTGSRRPTGESFYINLVIHELGHQLGADHSFNATSSDACDGSQRDSSSAYEPGSGSTVMAYAGICGEQNLQRDSDPYFHAISIDQIRNYADGFSGRSCGTVTQLNNNIPQVELDETSYSIPANTPFVLRGSATDADNDALSYSWEQYDAGGSLGATASLAELNGDNGSNPLFRSFPPSTDGQRYLPKLEDVLAGTTNLGEAYPSTDRDMRFRLTVRDNKGGVTQEDVDIQVVTNDEAFAINEPRADTQWSGLSEQTVRWEVANTDAPPVNCANMDILLDTNGDNTFDTELALATPNDGFHNINTPDIGTVEAKLKLKCSDNIFYTVSTIPIAPIITGQSAITIAEDSDIDIALADLSITDPDSNFPADFNLTIQTGDNYTFNGQTVIPDQHFNGQLSVGLLVNDGELDSEIFQFVINVSAVNDAPQATNDTISVMQDSNATNIDVLANDVDVEGSSLSITSISYSGQGQASIVNEQISYAPARGFSGSETITYTLSDGDLTTEGSLTITVTATSVPTNSSDTGGGGSVFTLLYLCLLSFYIRSVTCLKKSV